MEDTLKLINDKFLEFSSLHARMKEDVSLLHLDKYVMKDNKGQRIPDVHEITLPFPSIFYNRIVSLLSSSNQQIEIESDSMNDKQISVIEKFHDDIDYEIDGLLSKRKMPNLSLLQWQRICARGSIGARCCIREDKKGNLLPDVIPIDMLNVAYEIGDDNTIWATNRSSRTKNAIEREYKHLINGKQALVNDFWDENVNEIWIGQEKIFEQENIYGYVPFVIEIAPTGYWLDDEDYMKWRGESILFIARNLYSEINRFGSILATLTEKSFNNNLQYMSKSGEQANPPDAPDIDVSRVYSVDMGGGFKGMPIEDTHNSAVMFWNILNELLQMATISKANYGVLSFPLSGVAISNMTEAQDKIIVPELQGYSMYKRQLAEMIDRQMIDLKISAELGETGHKKQYSFRDLKGDYSIKYRFFSVSKEQEIADASIANAMGVNVSDDYKRRHIFKLQDPDGESRKIQLEMLQKTNPVIMRYKLVHDLIDEKKDLEARIILHELLMMIRSNQTSIGLPELSKGGNKDLIPLLEAGGTASQVPGGITP